MSTVLNHSDLDTSNRLDWFHQTACNVARISWTLQLRFYIFPPIAQHLLPKTVSPKWSPFCSTQIENGADSSDSTHSETWELRHVYENGANSSHSMHSETWRFPHVYENGADSSNSMHSETWELRHVYENGADSSHPMHSETWKFAYVYENGADSSPTHS